MSNFFQIQQCFCNNMFRVILKIKKVCLRLKQNPQVQIAIKKGHQNFPFSSKATLNKCEAEFNTQVQFFVNSRQPKFSILVMLMLGNARKLAGVYNLDLQNFQQNSTNMVHERLEQSPDPESNILFQFVYMSTNYLSENKCLVSTEQIQFSDKNQMNEQMQQRNVYLTSQNSRLEVQLAELQNDNKNLNNNKGQMNNYYQESLKAFENKMQMQAEKTNMSQQNMNQMRHKMNRLRELIEEHGDQEMKNKVYQFFRQQQ